MRLPRASEIAEATEHVFGESVHHTGTRSGGRAYRAKCIYWAALLESGYSTPEIATMTGADRATIANGLKHARSFELVDWVLKRAREIVDENDATVLS